MLCIDIGWESHNKRGMWLTRRYQQTPLEGHGKHLMGKEMKMRRHLFQDGSTEQETRLLAPKWKLKAFQVPEGSLENFSGFQSETTHMT